MMAEVEKVQKKRSKLVIFGLILVGIIFIMLCLKALSNEDDWICQDGQWVEHGHPSAPKPTTPCK